MLKRFWRGQRVRIYAMVLVQGYNFSMAVMGYFNFLKTLPGHVQANLPEHLRHLRVHQPYRWLLQFYDGDRRIHYEVQRISRRKDFELGLHCEARDKAHNKYLLRGFQQNLVALKAEVSEAIEAEMWDRGWTKIYEVMPEAPLTDAYQAEMGQRLAQFMAGVHPILVELERRKRGR